MWNCRCKFVLCKVWKVQARGVLSPVLFRKKWCRTRAHEGVIPIHYIYAFFTRHATFRPKDTVCLPLVIHPQNIRLLQGPLHHKSLLLRNPYASWAIRYSECSSRTILGDIPLSWRTVSLLNSDIQNLARNLTFYKAWEWVKLYLYSNLTLKSREVDMGHCHKFDLDTDPFSWALEYPVMNFWNGTGLIFVQKFMALVFVLTYFMCLIQFEQLFCGE